MGVPAQAKRANSPFHHLFFAIQAISGLDGTHLHWWGPSSLLSLPIQWTISSGNTLTDASKNSILLAIWASLSLVQMTHQINHHSSEKSHENKTKNTMEYGQWRLGHLRFRWSGTASWNGVWAMIAKAGKSFPWKYVIFDNCISLFLWIYEYMYISWLLIVSIFSHVVWTLSVFSWTLDLAPTTEGSHWVHFLKFISLRR